MFNRWRRFSYAAQKDQVHRIRWILVWVAAFVFSYFILTSFFFFTAELETDTMQPALHRGDRFIFSSHAIYRLLPDAVGSSRIRRGSIVLLDTSLKTKRSILHQTADMVIRFFSAQRLSLLGRNDSNYLKRVVGLPGDEVTMTNYIVRVRPAGSAYDLTEYERSDELYDVTIPQVPALWDESLPFSGNMEPIVLGENQCFVLSDDRTITNDSRIWGPVDLDLIAGKALLRYWPLSRFGRP